jgi:beta-phosphoglucomutase-like phosphatase (HAD superfamily)
VTVGAAILDVDGTLVDTNYQHALCWYRAFREHGIVLPVWRLHRHVGMGGDQFVEAVAGKRVEELREVDAVEVFESIQELRNGLDATPLAGAAR